MKHLLNPLSQYHVAQDDFVPPAGWVEVPPRPGAWDTWDGSAWVPGSQPVEEVRAGQSLRRVQLAMAAFAVGAITKEEAAAWSGPGALPAAAMAAIATLPEPQRSLAEIRLAGVQTIERLDPFIELMRMAWGMTEEDVDALFALGMTL